MKYLENGRISDSVRRSQGLPMAWDIPTATQIDDLKLRLQKLADQRTRTPPLVVIEGAILLTLCMQTGTHADVLLAAYRASEPLSVELPVLLINNANQSSIIVRPTAATKPLNIPQTKLLSRLLARLPLIEQSVSALFRSDPDLIIQAAFDLVRSDDWRTRTTKATRSLLAHRRWLYQRLRDASRGDPAFVALLQPNRPAAEQTLAAYCAVPHAKFTRCYRRAMLPLGGVEKTTAIKAPKDHVIGQAIVPTDDALRADVAKLRRQLARPMNIPAKMLPRDQYLGPLSIPRTWHLSMMVYTFALVTFGTGQRARRSPCSEAAIEPKSGFAWVIEKGKITRGHAGARGVFHTRSVRQQLTRYDEYLDSIVRRVPRNHGHLAEALRTLRDDKRRLAFFDIRDGKVCRMSPHELCIAARSIGWGHDAATGRRWLRSKLTATVPSDALAAQFGHNLDGLDVWSEHSGLRVRELPTILAPAIESALRDVGFTPASARRPKRRPKSKITVSLDATEQALLKRSGHVLASMIWHGALLQEDQFVAALVGLNSVYIAGDQAPYILLDASGNKTSRWVLDPATQALLNAYRMQGQSTFSATLTAIITDYFDSNADFAEFVRQARERWRFRLPPILFAKAEARLQSLDLPDSQSAPTATKTAETKRESYKHYADSRLAAEIFIEWFKAESERPVAPKAAARRNTSADQSPGQQRKPTKWELFNKLDRELPLMPFWQQMSPAERWIAEACVKSLKADRGKENVRGYSPSTIIKWAKAVFRYFGRQASEELKSRPIDTWSAADVQRCLPISKQRYGVTTALKALLTIATLEDDRRAIAEMLDLTAQKNKAMYVTAEAYGTAIQQEIDHKRRLMWLLCYRLGIRMQELSTIIVDMYLENGSECILRLDHGPARRLKTFHSRRIIPLDILLDSDEKELLRNYVKNRHRYIFAIWQCQDDDLVEAFQKAARCENVSAWALRHSFATNLYAALLWPDAELPQHASKFDPLLLNRRTAVRKRLCGQASLGALAPHAAATVMGHTSPWRTLYNYVHNLEYILAAHVAAWHAPRKTSLTSEACR